ncbi:MAG: tRNA 2-thiouridine(34) synthase MnmA [Actinomycetia bacterium]|nr:tRNA 2-thiouridine(34) synthase MnmA [Actinomycetes bacterium]
MVGSGKTVMVAMSGGVDSAVAASVLAEAGHEVVGVTLKLWGGDSDSGCCSVSDVDDARRVARQIGIEHHVFNLGQDFERFVIDPYVADHQAGRTPNPCIECNRHIKFDKLLRRADALGFDYVATGHHAQIVRQSGLGQGQGDEVLRIGRGADPAKDQSYVLHMLDQSQLERLLLPVGALTKDEVRQRAVELGLRVAAKPDSQDVCFIHSDGGRRAFLGDRIPLAPARLVDLDGNTVGRVASVELMTIGQRRGLDLGGDAERRYVIDIDPPAGVVTVGHRSDLMVESQSLEELAFSFECSSAGGSPIQGVETRTFQCSAHGQARSGRLRGTIINWDSPQPIVARGQSIVIYDGDLVLGGGIAGPVWAR